MAKKETALMKPDGYAIIKADPKQLAGVVRANLGGQNLTEFDLERVKIPTGGALTWEIGDDESSKMLEGIMVHWRDGCAYWEESFDSSGGGTPPDCSSQDGLTGIGTPGGICGKCPFNEFGSGTDAKGKPTKGKACKNFRVLFMMRPEELLPMAVIVPPTSLREVRRYFLRLASRAIPYHSLVTQLTLEKTKSGEGITYSRIKCAASTRLSAKEQEAIKSYSDGIASAFTAPIIVESREVAG